MSDRHRDRGDHRRHRSRSKSPSVRKDWRNVRVKEEPLSDVEGRGGQSRSHSSRDRRDRDYDKGGRGGDSHSRRRSRSRSRERDRGGGRDERQHRDRGERGPPPRIKSEPRSRSRSPGHFVRPHPKDEHNRDRHRPHHDQNRDRDHRRNDRDDDRRPSPPPRDVKRERDWDNFFNPGSDMSREANVKREQRAQDDQQQQVAQFDEDGNQVENVEKEKPNFGLSGKLTEETNTYRGVVIKYSEPPEARKPIKTRWRLYPFKDGEPLEVMYIHRQSAYLLGRERKIADIPIDHPSCSKQHAVIQYRLVPYEKPNGLKGRRIRPYIIDLESSNGTLVNGKKIDAKRYTELFEKDVLKFGFSSREYVLLHEHSQDDDPLDDDGYDKSPSPE